MPKIERVGTPRELAVEFGGTFVSPESGNRGDSAVHASFFCCEEQQEEEERVFGDDPLRDRIDPEEITKDDLPWNN